MCVCIFVSSFRSQEAGLTLKIHTHKQFDRKKKNLLHSALDSLHASSLCLCLLPMLQLTFFSFFADSNPRFTLLWMSRESFRVTNNAQDLKERDTEGEREGETYGWAKKKDCVTLAARTAAVAASRMSIPFSPLIFSAHLCLSLREPFMLSYSFLSSLLLLLLPPPPPLWYVIPFSLSLHFSLLDFRFTFFSLSLSIPSSSSSSSSSSRVGRSLFSLSFNNQKFAVCLSFSFSRLMLLLSVSHRHPCHCSVCVCLNVFSFHRPSSPYSFFFLMPRKNKKAGETYLTCHSILWQQKSSLRVSLCYFLSLCECVCLLHIHHIIRSWRRDDD